MPVEKLLFHATPWTVPYTLFCVAASFPLLFVTIPAGLSVASDAVFGAFVMIGGPLGDLAFRKVFRKAMHLTPKIPLIWLWPAIGALVMIFRPFE